MRRPHLGEQTGAVCSARMECGVRIEIAGRGASFGLVLVLRRDVQCWARVLSASLIVGW